MELKEILDQVLADRSRDFLANDPLDFPRRYASAADREAAAFLSAALAYGRVAIIRNNLRDLFRRMPEGPAAFVRNFDPARDLARLEGFRHRFNSGADVGCLCFMLRRMIEEAGSLEGFFRLGDDPAAPDIGPALNSFCRRALALDVSAVVGRRHLPPDSTVRYFLPRPEGGSACKRLCMFLRWVCRPDDGIDLGLWTIAPARLVVPLDTHIARISQLLGFTSRRSPGWKMALEVTEALRGLDAADPMRYDFALSHLGISEGCTGKEGRWCVECAVFGKCEIKSKP
jgi:uncharacterized protein (TIGR02757 family)